MDNTLLDILSLRRAHTSKGEAEFVKRYLEPIEGMNTYVNTAGESIAYVMEVKGDTSKTLKSNVLWSCHIDTMHRLPLTADKPDAIEQEVYITDDGLAFVTDNEDCLGADDGAGAWLMLKMIEAGVRGTYIFHRGEERGCWGSGQIAKHHTDWLEQFTHAIAFDRRGNTSIITHQRGERACSDALGEQLIKLFDMNHELDPTGVYTDTAEYMDIIPECVNISIGYQHEHSNHETLDVSYVMALMAKITSLDWNDVDLIVERDPAVRDYGADAYDPYGGWSGRWNGYGYGAGYDYDTSDPSIDDLKHYDYTKMKAHVKSADIEDLTWTMLDLIDRITELEYDLEFYTEHERKLDVGMR